MDLQTQYATAILMSASGAVLGAIYDMYRTSLKEWRFLRPLSPIFDFFFWVFATVFVFTLLLGTNDGDVRLIVFVLLGLGYFVYYHTLHPLVVASIRLVVRLVYACATWICKIFLAIFVTPIVYLWRLILQGVTMLLRLLLKAEPIITWPLVQTGRALRWTYSMAAAKGRKFIPPAYRWGKELGRSVSNRTLSAVRKWLHRQTDNGGPDDT